MTRAIALDAWAMLAFLQREEPAAARLRELLEDAARGRVRLSMSIVNLGEVFCRVGKVRGVHEAEVVLTQIRKLPITFVSVTDEAVLAAARVKINHTISVANAFAIVTAKEAKATLLTGDPEMDRVGDLVRIEKLTRQR